mgnify:CR=1 FL=1
MKITVQNGGLWDTQNPHNVVVGEFGKDLENVTATVKVDGKTANNYDEAGLIGEGTHQRAIVAKERFEQKAQSKLAK